MLVRCPDCRCFANRVFDIPSRGPVGWCPACGKSFDVALASGPRRAETAKQAQGVAGQSGPKGNAHD